MTKAYTNTRRNRMKFFQMFPESVAGFKSECGMVRIADLFECWNCDMATSWIDTEMGEAVCSTECRRRLHLVAGGGKTKWLEKAGLTPGEDEDNRRIPDSEEDIPI